MSLQDLEQLRDRWRREGRNPFIQQATCVLYADELDAIIQRMKAQPSDLFELAREYVHRCPMCNAGDECHDDLCFDFREAIHRAESAPAGVLAKVSPKRLRAEFQAPDEAESASAQSMPYLNTQRPT